MEPSAAASFIDALGAKRGIVAAVGAGGKKTTLLRLIEAYRALDTSRIALTTTVKMASAAPSPTIERLVGSSEEILSALVANRDAKTCMLIAAPAEKTGRLAGLPPTVIDLLHSVGRFDITLVKADGARMRLIKAPNPDEPLLPEGVATILPIVSARVLGKPLSARIAHRPERLATVVDAPIGVRLAPLHVARLLTSSDGALHRVGSAHVVPIINMVDSPELLSLARQAAKAALAATDRYDRIILTSMTAASPVIDIVSRSA